MGRKRDEEGCLPAETIRHSAYRAFTKFEFRAGRTQPDWEELDEDVRAAWDGMVNGLIDAFEGLGDDGEAGISLMAYRSYQGFYETGLGHEIPVWDELHEVVQKEWRYLVRHVANLLAYDTEDTGGLRVEDHEDMIDDHLRVALEEMGFSMSEHAQEDMANVDANKESGAAADSQEKPKPPGLRDLAEGPEGQTGDAA